MKLAIKPPYTVAATLAGVINSPDDMYIIHAVDELMRSLRMYELATGIAPEVRNALLEKHVDAAFEYYAGFTKSDMAKMLLVESVLSEGGEEDE